MVKRKQRKAALFLVICMVLSMFNGIPVHAEEPDETETGSDLQFAWWESDWHEVQSEDEEEGKWVKYYYPTDSVDGWFNEESGIVEYGSDPRGLNLYITADGDPVEEITISYYGEEAGIDSVRNNTAEPEWTNDLTCIVDGECIVDEEDDGTQLGYFENIPFGEAEGLYTISTEDYVSYWWIGLPRVGFYYDTDRSIESYATDFSYTRGTEDNEVYVIAVEEEDKYNYWINADNADYINLEYVNSSNETEEPAIENQIESSKTPVKVTINENAKGDFNIWVSEDHDWNDETEEGINDAWLQCHERSVGLVAAYAHPEHRGYDEDKECDVYEYVNDSGFWKYENPWISKDQMLYLGYREDEEEAPAPITDINDISIKLNGKDNIDIEYTGEEGYFTVDVSRIGEYTITYDKGENTSTVTLETCFPGIGFYTGTEVKDGEYHLQNVSYERGKGDKVFYIVPDLLTDDQGNNGRSISYTVSLGNEDYVTYVTLEKQNGGNWVPVAVEDEITDVPVRVTVSDTAKNDFRLYVAGDVTNFYYEDGELQKEDDPWPTDNNIWINEAMTGLVTSWDWEYNDEDVPELKKKVWYDKEIWVDLSGFECYFGYRESEEGEATPVTLTRSNITYEDGTENISNLVWIEGIEGVPGFYRFSFNKTGTYTVTYQGSSIVIHVEWSPIGFYSVQEAEPENMIDWYTLWKSSGDIAANKVYFYTGDRELLDKDKHGKVVWEEDENEYAFGLTMFKEDEGAVWQAYDLKGNLQDGYTNQKFLEVTSLDNGWYELQFKTNDMVINGDGGDTWEADAFTLCVITADDEVQKNVDGVAEGDVRGHWLSGGIRESGFFAAQIDGQEEFYEGYEPISFGPSIFPRSKTIHIGRYDVGEDGYMHIIDYKPEDLGKMTVQRREMDTKSPEEWEPEDWMLAKEGEAYEYKFNTTSGGIDFAFYYQGYYEISFEEIEETVLLHAWMEGIEIFDTPVRPADNDRVENLLTYTRVNEGDTKTVYALMYVDDNNPYGCIVDSMDFVTYDVNGKEVKGYVEKGKPITGNKVSGGKDVEGIIGYELNITNQAKGKFTLVVTAGRPVGDTQTADVIVEINNIKNLKIATPPTKTAYTVGEKFDPAGMVVKAFYEDDDEAVITGYTVSPAGALTAADKKVTITYLGKSVEQPITVTAAADPGVTGPETPAVPDKGTPIEDDKNSDGSYTVSSSDSANPTVEYKAPKNKNAKEVKIPDTIEKDGITYKVTSIAPNAFKNNKKVTKVTIGNNITTIGKNAFSGCKNLKTLTIGKNVTTIGESAFKGCAALTKVKIPAKTTTIGKNAFSGCKKLKTVTVGKNVTSIGANAFKGCTALTKITLPAKTTKIGKNAFSGCKNLKTITIKSTKIKSFTKGAFSGLGKNTVIKVPKSKKAAYAALLKKAGFKGTVK